MEVLVCRDNKQKIRVVEIFWIYNENTNSYFIKRKSGLFDGKKVTAPDVEIKTGKVKRTAEEQTILQFNSEIKKYLDKGYRNVKDFGLDNPTVEQLDAVLPKLRQDQHGAPKPMLCKVLNENDKTLTERQWYGSYKCDGVRMILYKKDGNIHTASRGGGNYDIAAHYITLDPYICTLFQINPDLILDGELYIHGKPLQYISGLVRKEVLEEEHKLLRYHCYDIVDETKPFKERVAILNQIKLNCPEESKLSVLEQRLISGLKEIQDMHDEAVSNGYEGLVIKDPDKEYKCGARDNRCLKLKRFTDAEAKIIGIVEGLRDEDMCFLMELDNGIKFKAKPVGDRALKQWYRDHIDEIVGKLGTYKYFYLSEEGVPILPTFRAIRDDRDI